MPRVRSTQKLPSVFALRRVRTANERDRDGQAGGGRGEVADGQDQHLAQVAGPGLARVVLPVGVRLEADRRVEREVRGLRGRAVRVERQHVLQAQDHVADHDGHDGHHQDRDRVALPVLLGRLVDPAGAVDRALNGAQDGAQDGALALHHVVDVGAQDRRDKENQAGEDDQRDEVCGGHG
jgi:hypothetical protein